LAFGDGLMESPRSRNWYCGFTTKPDHIITHTAQFPACSTAFAAIPMAGYNFMTVVTHSWGRAKTTPLPAHVCSFDSESWKGVQTPWDVPMDWPTSPMGSGMQSITWNASWGAHYDDTRDFSYWITKPGFVFSPARELTWDDFESEPFCMELYDNLNPTANPNVIVDKTAIKFTTKCNVPARSGRHVIYGEWGRTESTKQRFHGCIDAAFGSSPVRTAAGRADKAVPPKARVDALGRKPPQKAKASFAVPAGKK
ncbi:MAG: lytic polysaccharide monooxygenase auxiliary activity family 9 protein, partial [Fibrobacteria bacterium]